MADRIDSSRALWNDLDAYRKATSLKSRVVERGAGIPSWGVAPVVVDAPPVEPAAPKWDATDTATWVWFLTALLVVGGALWLIVGR